MICKITRIGRFCGLQVLFLGKIAFISLSLLFETSFSLKPLKLFTFFLSFFTSFSPPSLLLYFLPPWPEQDQILINMSYL